MGNLADLFNPLGAVEVKTPRNQDEYKVDYKDSKTGVYESVVRFIPNVNDPSRCIAAKRMSWVQNPITQVGMYIDDPQSIGQPSPVVDMYFRCYKSNNAQVQEFAKKHISTRQNYAALVQIIKDSNHPELEGQIKVFKFGKKLWDKIHAEEHPAFGDGYNPFHPISGRYFYIKCVSVAGYNNFDQSCFTDNKVNGVSSTGFFYKDPAKFGDQFIQVTDQSDQQAVADYLLANSPDLSKYEFQPWTPEQEKHVNETLAVIANYVQGGATNLQSNLQTLATPTSTFSQASSIPVNNNPVFPGATMPGMKQPQTPAPAPTPTPTPNMGGISLGESTLPGVGPAVSAPGVGGGISGIDLPSVAPVSSGVGYSQPGAGIGGNLDDIIAQL